MTVNFTSSGSKGSSRRKTWYLKLNPSHALNPPFTKTGFPSSGMYGSRRGLGLLTGLKSSMYTAAGKSGTAETERANKYISGLLHMQIVIILR